MNRLEVLNMFVNLLLAYEERYRSIIDLLESDLDEDDKATMEFMLSSVDRLIEEPISRKMVFLSEFIPLIERHEYEEIIRQLSREICDNTEEGI